MNNKNNTNFKSYCLVCTQNLWGLWGLLGFFPERILNIVYAALWGLSLTCFLAWIDTYFKRLLLGVFDISDITHFSILNTHSYHNFIQKRAFSTNIPKDCKVTHDDKSIEDLLLTNFDAAMDWIKINDNSPNYVTPCTMTDCARRLYKNNIPSYIIKVLIQKDINIACKLLLSLPIEELHVFYNLIMNKQIDISIFDEQGFDWHDNYDLICLFVCRFVILYKALKETNLDFKNIAPELVKLFLYSDVRDNIPYLYYNDGLIVMSIPNILSCKNRKSDKLMVVNYAMLQLNGGYKYNFLDYIKEYGVEHSDGFDCIHIYNTDDNIPERERNWDLNYVKILQQYKENIMCMKNNFFNPKDFHSLLNKTRNKGQTILCFHYMTIYDIISNFEEKLNIRLSKGSNSSKGILTLPYTILVAFLLRSFSLEYLNNIVKFNNRLIVDKAMHTPNPKPFIVKTENSIKRVVGISKSLDIEAHKKLAMIKRKYHTYHSKCSENVLNKHSIVPTKDPYSTTKGFNPLKDPKNILYNSIKNLLSEGINENTQIKIEELIKDNEKQILNFKKLGINASLLNKDVTKFLFDKEGDIAKYLDVVIDSSMHNNVSSKSISSLKKDKLMEYYINMIISNSSKSWLLNCLLYIFLYIATNTNIIIKDQIVNYETTICIKLGKLIVNKYINKDQLKIPYKEKLEIWLAGNKNGDVVFEDEFCIRLASIFITILQKCDMLSSHIHKDPKDYTKIRVLQISPTVNDNIKEFLPIITGDALPMICKPGKHGYLLNNDTYYSPILQTKPILKTKSVMNKALKSIIKDMSSVPFKINKELLHYLYNEGFELIKPVQPKSDKKGDIMSNLSMEYLKNTILNIAEAYKDVPELYFPIKLDHRGRMYPIPTSLNYQGSELAKALLLFARPESINLKDDVSLRYLIGYGGCCFDNGLSKKSFYKRYTWAMDNWNDIINYKTSDIIHKAENKILFACYCIEMVRLHECNKDINNQVFQTYLPIQLDGTCNGFQHLALLSNEVSLYENLNLGSGDECKDPHDFYKYIIIQILVHIKTRLSEIDSSHELWDSYNRLFKIQLNRSHIKSAIMTKPYNAGDRTIAEYIAKNMILARKEEVVVEGKPKYIYWYKASDDPKDIHEICFKDIWLLTRILNNIIYVKYPQIKNLLNYLKDVCEIMSTQNLPIVWDLPTGLIVKQQYLKTKTKVIRPYKGKDNSISISIIDPNITNKVKQFTALMPNLVHSLDAAVVVLLYRSLINMVANYKPNFYSIHDCYCTTANNIPYLIDGLRAVYVQLYSNKGYIETFDNGIIQDLCSYYNLNEEQKQILTQNRELVINTNYSLKLPQLPNLIDTSLKLKYYDEVANSLPVS